MDSGIGSRRSTGEQVAAIHSFIKKHASERQVNKILHGFPSPRFWHERSVPVKEVLAARTRIGRSRTNKFWLYVATPYCIRTEPEKCGYCLFPVEVFTGMGQLDTYLRYLEMEGRLYQGLFEDYDLHTIYFGGGTSNLYKASQYPRLLEIVRKLFPDIGPNVAVILEGIPQLFTREKLETMRAGGVTRISMGAQQLNDELNKFSGRKQTPQHVFQAVEWCQELDLQCNVDLIFGWPRQTVDLMLKDLERLVQTGVRHITHYELNVGGPSDFALNRRDELPTIGQNLEMYRASKQYLESEGFVQSTAYDWSKPLPGEYVYEECMRDFDDYEMFGWGYAGVSYYRGSPSFPGWTYINHRKVGDYFGALDRGAFPIERGFRYELADLKLTMLFRNLLGMEVNRKSYQSFFGVDLLDEYHAVWQALSELGWLDIGSEKIRLIGDGVFYTPLIQTLLGATRATELKALAVSS